MVKCSCYINHPYSSTYGYCSRTKNRALCACQGDEDKCDFYTEKRNKKMFTLDMMTMARMNNKTYRAQDMLYNTKFGFHDKRGHKWGGDAFTYLNELFTIDDWKEDTTTYMTKSEAEKKYGIKIVGD